MQLPAYYCSILKLFFATKCIMMSIVHIPELNFKLVMCRCGGKNRTSKYNKKNYILIGLFPHFYIANRHLRKEDVEYSTPVDDMRTIFLEEIRELKNTLAAERSKNNHLMRVIEKKVLEGQKNSRYVLGIFCHGL